MDKDKVNLKINGEKYSVGSEVSVNTSLNEFIRRCADKRGTKYMCLEGGCGACVVNVRAPKPHSQELDTFSVNSCLVSILSCDGWEVTTDEYIGNRVDGYNVIQKRLDRFFGSQCGYCSPGFVMSMYSLMKKSHGNLSEAEIEKSFGSNLCRCTGYRPILEAFKSLASDPDIKLLNKIKDIEDLDKEALCPKSGEKCNNSCGGDLAKESDWCLVSKKELEDKEVKKIALSDGRYWYTVPDVQSIFDTLNAVGYESYMLVAGNTAKGARPVKFYPKILIDVSNIEELKSHYIDTNLVLGANMTLTDTMDLFKELSETNEDFYYLSVLYEHLEQVAHIPVRNIGTIAGNLVLKHEHPDFQSDVFILLEGVGAILTIVDRNKRQTQMSLTEFMETTVVGKVITKIKLPPLSRHNKVVTYKIAEKEQNAHAHVNSAFLLKFNSKNNNIEEARLVFGGINPKFIHAYKTEQFLKGRDIFNNAVLQKALHCLDEELNPNYDPPEPSPQFRRKAAVGLFYKAIIKLCPHDILKPIYESGATISDRPPVSQSHQEYDTDKKEYPITQPLLKKEGIMQCAGEALYTEDMPRIKNEVFAALVLSNVSKADIESIDGSEALKVDGVVAVYTSADIPGVNSIAVMNNYGIIQVEELLASDKVKYYNQPVAIVVAETQDLADRSTYLVKVHYKNISNDVVFTIKDAIHAPKEENRITKYVPIIPNDRGKNVKKVIKGEFYSPRQYHHMMELHSCVAVPADDRLEIQVSVQYIDTVQATVAALLNVPENLIYVETRRCGGAFGGKIYRINFTSCTVALAARLLNRPCRMSMHLRDIMRATGKRPDCNIFYEVGVDDKGEIQYLEGEIYVNDGLSNNENENMYVADGFKNCYDPSRWDVKNYAVTTDSPTNCYMRAPGTQKGMAGIEHVMDHIAAEIGKDPIDVRMANYRKSDNALPELVPMFLKKSEYRERQNAIQKFNAHNRWKKRGLAFSNMIFNSLYVGNYLALVSVYHNDGSVSINAGGIEIGQGIYTRLTQVAANQFGIPVNMVTVYPATNNATPNNYATGSSVTTECSAYSVIRACDEIKARLAPVIEDMPNASWRDLVYEADRRGISLQASYLTNPNDTRLMNYPIPGIAAVEVELDIITGRHWIVRADIFEDTGKSINPALDVGQVEGAFVQGLSLWTKEKLVYDEHTGELLTDRTWDYHIIGAMDIPYDYRVYLRRKAPNPVGILGSKAVGEPPICMSHVIVQALRESVKVSRLESAYHDPAFVPLDVPVTSESALLAAEPKLEEYLLY